MWIQFLGEEDPWRRAWQPTPVFLPGEFHGQKSLGATVHRVTESDTTESIHNLKGRWSPLGVTVGHLEAFIFYLNFGKESL